MSLLDLWQKSPEQLKDKHVQQLIAFAGCGKLKDGDAGSQEFRDFLAHVTTDDLKRYASDCLESSFTDSGLALQDIVNEVGRRIGASVQNGRYRGTSKHIGHDGLWHFPQSGHSIIVEVKTTDAYRIDLTTIAEYKRALEEQKSITEEKSSILIVVGRQDTGDLEAQIRGSRYAWDIRIISVDSLLRLVVFKEDIEDPGIVNRIHQILVPREFTRLDEIAELLFSAAKDLTQDESDTSEKDNESSSPEPRSTPVAFNQACIDRIMKHLGTNLLKLSRSKYSSVDGSVAVNCSVSKEYDPDKKPGYWFAFHSHQKDFLAQNKKSFVAFGCGSPKDIVLIPFDDFIGWLDRLSITEREDQYFWHVIINKESGGFVLYPKKGNDRIDLSKYTLRDI